MAIEDIRIGLDFPDHRKTRRMVVLLGEESIRALQRLWIYAGLRRSKGILTKMTVQDIADAARWEKTDAKTFVDALVEVRFLDRKGRGGYSIHNWKKHQPWAFYSDERTQRAEAAAAVKWGKKAKQAAHDQTADLFNDAPLNGESCPNPELPLPDNGLNDANGTNEQCGSDAGSNAPSPIPSPTPSPSPNKATATGGQATLQQRPELANLFHNVFNASEWRYVLDGVSPWEWVKNVHEEFGTELAEQVFQKLIRYYQEHGFRKPSDPMKARAKAWEWFAREKEHGPAVDAFAAAVAAQECE